MIFQFTHELVLSGRKTQTRRIVKDGDFAWIVGRSTVANPVTGREPLMYSEILNQQGEVIRPRWRRETTYAVCPGRGKKAVGRIEITGMRREDVRNISWDDAVAEGFESPLDFLGTWVQMHDRRVAPLYHFNIEKLPERPAEKYQAWVLEFRLVEVALVEPAG